MTREVLTAFIAAFSDPMLVLSTDGVVMAANAAAHRLFGGPPLGRHLSELVDDGPDKIDRLIALWSRTSTMSLGAFTARGPGGPVPCRADGARIAGATPEAAPTLLAWCRRKGDEETTSRFLGLNQRIAALGAEIGVRKQAEAELREQREWLRVTLASIGDAVVACDRDGRVTFMNAVAQELTGWPVDEAAGKAIDEIVPLLSEHTREAADNPIARVLQDGRVVGLANNTLLVDRHGRERPIDDSAAPIVGGDGRVIGVVMVFRDVSERRRLQRDNARQLAELAEADRRKDEFLAMLGHELRNPLAAMVNAMAMQRMAGADEAARRRTQDVIERQLAVMERLVDDLLDVARIRRGAIELRREVFDVRTAAERAVEIALPVFTAQGVTLTVDQPAHALWVDGDPVRIEQVVANLLSNAAKYTPRGGRVEITTGAHGDDAVLTVRDNGAGIDRSLLSGIFDLFVQGNAPLHRPTGGLGIGLTLVRTLVEMHGGRVEAVSAGPGEGSTFTVRLPRAAAPAAIGAGAAARRPGGGSVRVLVVDDHEDSAEMLAMLLRTSGHDVETAADGPSAIAAVIRFRPRLVLLDIGLPGMDGYAVATALRAVRDIEPVFLVALTGYGQPSDRARAREAGFDLHVVKPITPEKLKEVLAGIAQSG